MTASTELTTSHNPAHIPKLIYRCLREKRYYMPGSSETDHPKGYPQPREEQKVLFDTETWRTERAYLQARSPNCTQLFHGVQDPHMSPGSLKDKAEELGWQGRR
ncbi:hypothetical protein M758_UG132900 [Ceratodon purpureus]|nr:hypothetical protein M758_UG132900 [Ceratodon purpureus]